ncbi:enoyl-CoA hydratase-related protein [Deferribacter thermophilus]|uniref:enoyl-CoA hydratase/isomerase family protein n=1 Tax=Deferribacter thermophilus TaxID=53573 RepID=UPI003C1B40FE
MEIIRLIEDNIGYILFDLDPYLNTENLKRIYEVLNEYENDPNIDLIVLKSRLKQFCSGYNLDELINFNEADSKIYSFLGQRLIKRIRDIKKIVISMVDGDALGGGFELALASDIIFATKRSRFGFPETNYGIISGFGGTQLMSRRIYETFTKYLVFTGELVDASVLYEKGFIAKIFENIAEMERFLNELKDKIKERSIFAIGLAKEVINNGVEIDLDKALLLEQNAFTVAFASKDKKEGMTAFLEKRKPIFKDRWEEFKKL